VGQDQAPVAMSSEVLSCCGARTHCLNAGVAVDASSGSMYSCSESSKPGSSGVGWMQSTGQTSTDELSFVPMHGSLMT
jgi:hypothetical protein